MAETVMELLVLQGSLSRAQDALQKTAQMCDSNDFILASHELGRIAEVVSSLPAICKLAQDRIWMMSKGRK